jgi:hypothetical protein
MEIRTFGASNSTRALKPSDTSWRIDEHKMRWCSVSKVCCLFALLIQSHDSRPTSPGLLQPKLSNVPDLSVPLVITVPNRMLFSPRRMDESPAKSRPQERVDATRNR